jgi:hypothetical protein
MMGNSSSIGLIHAGGVELLNGSNPRGSGSGKPPTSTTVVTFSSPLEVAALAGLHGCRRDIAGFHRRSPRYPTRPPPRKLNHGTRARAPTVPGDVVETATA